MTRPVVEPFDTVPVMLSDGFIPGSVAPFVMRYGTDFLVAMQRAATSHDAARSAETEPEPA